MPKTRVLLIGWDAADWKVIQPLIQAGEMPNLAGLIAAGVHGNLATIYPVLSPMLWTSIATGKRAYKHGIHGFTEPLPDASGVRPVSLLSRKTKAIWNILNQNGHRSIVVGWWPSHPAEPLNGVMVSNLFQQPCGDTAAFGPLLPGTIYPTALNETLSELRVHPMELSGEFIRLFVPDYDQVDQTKDKRLHSVGKIIAETLSVHAAATELLSTQTWDFAAIYYSALDHFGHGFMRYHPPRLPWVPEPDFAMYQHVIANAYRYHDAMLGTLLRFADENTSVILMSDHGFHPDHMRAGYIPAEPAGPAVEHRHFGILCLKGPAFRVDEPLFGASLLDVCPTILTLFGLPPGKDMDGKVLLNAFKEPPPLAPIESWDAMPGQAGTHPPETRLDPTASAQAFKQLVDLGYVAPPGAEVNETVEECIQELKYNLARAYRDGNCCGDAAAIAEELWARWPREHRFGILLVECLGLLRQVGRRREVIEELGRRIERYQTESKTELARREEEKARQPKSAEPTAIGLQAREQYNERQLRELAFGRPLLLEWFLVSQALLEKKPAQARIHLKQLTEVDGANNKLSRFIAGALAQLGDTETARDLLEESLGIDSENPLVHAQLAELHLKAGRFDQAIGAATESLSLLYFQPGVHALLGEALMKAGRFAEAEQELRVAVAQSPRNLLAHELLAILYREHLLQPAEAFAHEGRARSLRHELTALAPAESPKASARTFPAGDKSLHAPPRAATLEKVPARFGSHVNANEVITVVSGLPRSGTSMMMQLLAAGGRQALTDGKRQADADNPLGYLEFEKAVELPKDSSWIPQARGKIVKVVAQLLPFLPRDEHYNVVFMERNLAEVLASQQAMLARQGRRGAELPVEQLMETYQAQLKRVHQQLAQRSEMRTLIVEYAALLADPVGGVDRLATFLGDTFDQATAVQTVRPALQNQRHP